MPAPRVVRLIGAPTDVGASVRGASMGPEAMRVAGLAPALQAQGLRVHDAGNLAGPGNPWEPARDGWRHLEQVVQWNRAVRDAVAEALRAGELPMLLGGDHCLGFGSVAAVAAHCAAAGRELRVLWLDAHADFNTAQTTPSGNLHGMPLACLCGMGPEPLLSLACARPVLHPRQLRLLGVRSVDELERRLLRQYQVPVHDMRAIDEQGMRSVMRRMLDGVDANTHVHLSLDVDFLDADTAPGVATSVRGGPTWREAQLCMEMLSDRGCVASIDVVELNPALDVRNRSAEALVELLQSLFGRSTLLRDAP
ncbi:arginase [Thiomonas sp.]|uniref:arginase n=1 Tax=Thiomonas sp. TaxID=2047785 RepID=UPI00262077B3|nr:arginase [Thiomonas sp.]